MKSARRVAYIAKKKKAERKSFPLYKLIIPLLFILGIFAIVKISTHVWNGRDKTALCYRMVNGDVGVSVLDPSLSETTTLVIPADTQVDVARNLGTMRIKNVWQLGINEKVGGILLPETITENFYFPVFLWGDAAAAGLGSGDFGKIFNFVFFPGQTNISFGDRLSMAIFAMKIQDFGRTQIDLGKNQYLTKQKLNDGEIGYIFSGPVSQRLTVYFSDSEISGQNIKINIMDATGRPGLSEKIGAILEVMGGKVVSVDKKVQPEDIDCVVYGENSKIMNDVLRLFSCQKGSAQSSFDLDIHLGTKFAKRF